MGWSTEDTFPRGFRNQARVPFQLVILGLTQVGGGLDSLLGSSRSTPLTHNQTLGAVVANTHTSAHTHGKRT